MQTPFVKSIAAAAFAICLIAGSASAQGKGHGQGKGEDKHGDNDKGRSEMNGHDNDDSHRGNGGDPRHGNNGQQGNVGFPVPVTTNNGDYRKVPPGLAKKGGLPPGQAKKYYHPADGVPILRDVFGQHGYTVVRTQHSGRAEYVYYRQANGPIQRAVILPGTSQLGFQNVPQQLLQEILARLY